jgi:hypothetical protein
MKGAFTLISAILIAAIYIFLAFLALKWAIPIFQKNLEILNLNRAEELAYLLGDKIDRTIKLGSIEEFIFDLPGEIKINAEKDEITFTLKSASYRYSSSNFTCLIENCSSQGSIGEEDFFILEARTYKFEDRSIIIYLLKFRNLTDTSQFYKIDLVTPKNITLNGKERSKFIIENLGEKREFIAGIGNVTTIFVHFEMT